MKQLTLAKEYFVYKVMQYTSLQSEINLVSIKFTKENFIKL